MKAEAPVPWNALLWVDALEQATDATVVVYEHHISLVRQGFVVARQPRRKCLVDDVLALGIAYTLESNCGQLELLHMKEVA